MNRRVTFRSDRVLTLHFFRLLQRIGFRNHRDRLPILMYHSVSADAEPGVSPYYRVTTTPDRFEEQMQCLADLGYRGVTLTEGLGAFAGSAPAPLSTDRKKLVAITFDDGFLDFHRGAFPVLSHYGFSATMYIATAFIADDRRSFKGRECLTWSEVSELHQAGVEFGSHTVNHPKLVDLAWPEIEHELTASKQEMENRLGETVSSFAYPFAFPQANRPFATRFRELLVRAGYSNCVTTAIGRGRLDGDLYQLPRLPVNSEDDQSLLTAKLVGAYDWMGLPQLLRKNTQRFLRQSKAVCLAL